MPRTPIAYQNRPEPPPKKTGLALQPGQGSLAHFILGNRWVYCRFLGLAVVALAALAALGRLEVSYEHGMAEAITTVSLSLAGAVTAWVRHRRDAEPTMCDHCGRTPDVHYVEETEKPKGKGEPKAKGRAKGKNKK